MNKPILSIIIPVYNVEKYISECLDSIICQHDINYEVIIIDDHSTDKSRNICNQYGNSYKNFKIFTNKKYGVSAARNLGIEKSSGKYLWFIDADDFISKKSFKTLKSKIETNDILIFGVKKFTKNHSSSTNYVEKKLDKETAIKRILADNDLMGYLANKIFSKDIIMRNKIKFDESIKTCEDLLFCTQYLIVANKIEVINNVLYYYRQRTGSAIKSKLNPNQATALNAYAQIAENNKLPTSSYGKASTLYIKAFYKYRPILNKTKKAEYQSKLKTFQHKNKNIQPKDFILIIGYRFFHPLMILLHRKQYKNKDLYE